MCRFSNSARLVFYVTYSIPHTQEPVPRISRPGSKPLASVKSRSPASARLISASDRYIAMSVLSLNGFCALFQEFGQEKSR